MHMIQSIYKVNRGEPKITIANYGDQVAGSASRKCAITAGEVMHKKVKQQMKKWRIVMTYGPVDFLALEFKNDNLKGEILPALFDLVKKRSSR